MVEVENAGNFSRKDSELTVATVETFLSETSVNTETAGGGERPEKPAETEEKTNNAQDLFQRGFLSQFYHKNIGTIIKISRKSTFLMKLNYMVGNRNA